MFVPGFIEAVIPGKEFHKRTSKNVYKVVLLLSAGKLEDAI